MKCQTFNKQLDNKVLNNNTNSLRENSFMYVLKFRLVFELLIVLIC